MWNLKYDTNDLFTKKKQAHGHRKPTWGSTRARLWGGRNSTFGISTCKLLHTKQMNSRGKRHSIPCSVQFSSVAQSRPTLCDPMNRSTPGLPVHHQLPEFTQTHVRRVSDAIQPSHPLSSPSPPAPNPSQHQSLFQ